MNVTYVTNTYKKADILFADFNNELWSIIILCLLILTRGIVSTLFKWMKTEEFHHHVHYSDEYSTSDLNLNLNLKPKPAGGVPNTPKPVRGNRDIPKIWDLSDTIKRPKEPPRDELV